MNSINNLYEYKNPKSGNEETGFFNIKGRITRATFFIRVLFAIIIYSISRLIYIGGIFSSLGLRFQMFFETIHLFILPFALCVFVAIQGAKRIHDLNKSGWYFIFPIYNFYLIFIQGTKGNNNYGIDPETQNKVKYFDELENYESAKHAKFD
jgi:uncharacterized membrane protein YhaH (DUF805 family)